MPVWLHLLIDTIAFFATVVLWWTITIPLLSLDFVRGIVRDNEVRTTVNFVVCAAGLGLGVIASRVFRKIPARCVKCGGKTFAEGNRPVRYKCKECGFVQLTKLRSNWGPL